MGRVNDPSYWKSLSTTPHRRAPAMDRVRQGVRKPWGTANGGPGDHAPVHKVVDMPRSPSGYEHWRQPESEYDRDQVGRRGEPLPAARGPKLPVRGLDDLRLAAAIVELCKLVEGDCNAYAQRFLPNARERYEALRRLHAVQKWRQRAERSQRTYEHYLSKAQKKERQVGEIRMPGRKTP